MEILGRGANYPSHKYLFDAVQQARMGNVDKAYDFAALFFDETLVHGIDRFSNEEGANHKNRIVKYGLIFTARLARFFGHFNKAHFLLVEAVQQAQGTNDFICLRLALLEEAMLDITTTRSAMLGRYTRSEEMPAVDLRVKGVFSNRTLTLGLAFNDELTPSEERAFADKNTDPNAKVFTEQLVCCAKYLKALNMAIRCESQETITHYLKSCLTLDLGVDRASHARIIREAARAAMSTIQLSLQLSCLNGACVQLSSQFAENASIVDQEESGQVRCCDESQLADEVDSTEANVIGLVNSAYLLALDGKFGKSLAMIEKIERRFPEGVNPALAHHWQMASACIQFDYNLFYGIEPDLELLECYSPTEADFRHAILLASRGEFQEASTLLEARLSVLQKGIDLVLTLRCLMILGLVYCEGGAIKTGIKTLEDVLLTSIVKSMKNFVCMIKRRLAYAYMINGNLNEATELLDACRLELDKIDSLRLERGMYYIVRFELAKRMQRMVTNVGQSEESSNKDHSVPSAYLEKALRTFRGHYPELEQSIYKEGSQLENSSTNSEIEQMRDLCAKLYQERSHHSGSCCLNWFLL